MGNDFLDYIKDLEKGKTPVSPDELAPPLDEEPTIEGGLEYDERADKEIEREAIKEQQLRAQLREASKAASVEAYVASTDNPTYEGFMNSEWAHPKETEEQFARDLAYLRKRGVAPGGTRLNTTGGKGYAAESGSKNAKERKAGPYDADKPEGYESKDEILGDLTKNYATASLKGSADEMFLDVFNVVRNIIVGRADKRHAVIAGDPGLERHTKLWKLVRNI